jgi:hypothetical protein
MKKNVGRAERWGRIGGGVLAILASSSVRVPRWGRNVLRSIGISGVITGSTRYCPINEAVGYNGYRPSERVRDKLRSIAG